jgi:hypothetical protein
MEASAENPVRLGLPARQQAVPEGRLLPMELLHPSEEEAPPRAKAIASLYRHRRASTPEIIPPKIIPPVVATQPLVESTDCKELQLSSEKEKHLEKEEELEAFLRGAVKCLKPVVQRAPPPWFLQGRRGPLQARTAAAPGGEEEFDLVHISMASSRHGHRYRADIDGVACRLSERCHDTASATSTACAAATTTTAATAAAASITEPGEALDDAQDHQQWLCMWCSVMNLGGELCANRRCLRDRSLAGIEQGATRKRAAPQHFDASAKASCPPEKVRAGRHMAVPKAVAALRQSEPLNAEPLSPRSAEHLMKRCMQFADVLKVEPRKSSPLRRVAPSSSPACSPGSPLRRSLSLSSPACSPSSPLNSPEVPSLAREVSTYALSPKFSFKNLRKSDPRVPPGGTISPMGYILDADGRLVRDADGRPMQVASDPLSVEGVGDDGSDSGSIGEKRQAASTPSPPPPPAETVDEVENGFEHIVLTEEQHLFCPECGDLLHTTTSGERFCNNVDCDNEVLFVLDA